MEGYALFAALRTSTLASGFIPPLGDLLPRGQVLKEDLVIRGMSATFDKYPGKFGMSR